MNGMDIVVLVITVLGVVGLGWYFFGPRRARTAEVVGGVQRVEVLVRGGYRPTVIGVRQDIPVELVFDRRESGDCTARVSFTDLGVTAALPVSGSSTPPPTPPTGLRSAVTGCVSLTPMAFRYGQWTPTPC